jgi:hypothetical protein
MFQSHPNLTIPDASVELWRYIDLSKFLFLLEHSALWFSRLDTLGDPYEGLPPRPLIDEMWSSANVAPASVRQHRIEIARHNTYAYGIGREIIVVSCWHANPVESVAMWSLYSRIGEGIAIKTTLERLGNSFRNEKPPVFGGLVRYVDFESFRPVGHRNVIDWATLKRTSFSHEQEFRAIVLTETGPLSSGVALPVDINTLIEAIYLSPAAALWLVELVRSICERYKVEAKVQQSDLLKHPAYMSRQID